MPIHSFDCHGDPIYWFSDDNQGKPLLWWKNKTHVEYDVCNCDDCLNNDDNDDDTYGWKPHIWRPNQHKKRKPWKDPLQALFEQGDPSVGLLGEPSG